MPIYAQGLQPPGSGRLLANTSANRFVNGVCTGVAGLTGQQNDTMIIGVIFAPNAAAQTITIVGCKDSTGAAANHVITSTTSALNAGSTYIPIGYVNDAGPLTITASAANNAIVLTSPLGD